MLLHMCPLHMGEQYNPAFGHPHVFRQPVVQPHDTIRNTRVGATGRSVVTLVSGTKLSSLYCQPQSVGHKLFPTHCCNFLLSCPSHKVLPPPGIIYYVVALSVALVRSSGEQGSSSSRQQRRWAIVCGSPQSQLTDCVLSM